MTRRAILTLVAGALLCAGSGALVAWRLKPAAPPLFRTVQVRDDAIQAITPRVNPTIADRLTKRTVAPTQVATSQGTPDKAAIDRFCAAKAAAAVLQTSANVQRPAADSASNPAAKPEAPSATPILPPFSGRFADNQLELQATRSDGSLWAATYPARPPFEWVAGHGAGSDTTAIVRENRALFRLLPHLGACARGGLLGGAIGAGAGLLTGLPIGKAAAIGAGAGCAGSQF